LTATVVRRVSIFPLIIPLRTRVSHAMADRGVADPIVAAVELGDGTVGYGETSARSYVTQETVDTVLAALSGTFVTVLSDFHPASFPEALEAIEALPWRDADGRLIPAARAAVELALLDAVLRSSHRTMDEVVSWMGLPAFGRPGSLASVRFSGVLASDDLAGTKRQLRRMYWFGLRHFKLKVGWADDWPRLAAVTEFLKRPLAVGRATLRVDANGVWSKERAVEWLADARAFPITAMEQPLARGDEDELPMVRDLFDGRLVHDESLVTREDAQRLIDLGVADVFNIRISKCGGLLPSLRLAALARRSEVGVQLGCMVGETSILSAAGLRFLEVCPAVMWAEGSFGSFLMRGDVVRRGLRFGFGGRLPRLSGWGLGVDVDPQRLQQFCEGRPIVHNL